VNYKAQLNKIRNLNGAGTGSSSLTNSLGAKSSSSPFFLLLGAGMFKDMFDVIAASALNENMAIAFMTPFITTLFFWIFSFIVLQSVNPSSAASSAGTRQTKRILFGFGKTILETLPVMSALPWTSFFTVLAYGPFSEGKNKTLSEKTE